jgi:hypothetical protein
MSLPQPHQPPPAPSDSPQEDDQSPSIVRYDSIQGALGGRRVSQPVPVTYRNVPDITAQSQMAPDSRYMYPSSSSVPQQQHFQYEQHQYPPSPSYEASQYSHNALPRMRTPHSHSEPSRTPVNQTPQSYGMPYMAYPQPQQAPYAVPSGMPTPSWGASYSQYPQTPTDASLSPELVRGEPISQPGQLAPGQYRTPGAAYPTHIDASRHASGSSRTSYTSDSKGKQREVETPPLRPRVPPEIDYKQVRREGLCRHLSIFPTHFFRRAFQLFETYQVIRDNATHSPAAGALPHAQPSGLPSSDTLNRIYDFAVEGVRQFHPVGRGELLPRSTTPQPQPEPLKGEGGGKGSSKRQVSSPRCLLVRTLRFSQRTEGAAAESQRCMGCGATSTPEWRRGPLGKSVRCLHSQVLILLTFRSPHAM